MSTVPKQGDRFADVAVNPESPSYSPADLKPIRLSGERLKRKQESPSGQSVDTRAIDFVLTAIGDVGNSTSKYMQVWRAITRWVESEVGHPVDLVAWYGDKFQIVPRELEAPTRELCGWWTAVYDRKPRLNPSPRAAAVDYLESWSVYHSRRGCARGESVPRNATNGATKALADGCNPDIDNGIGERAHRSLPPMRPKQGGTSS